MVREFAQSWGIQVEIRAVNQNFEEEKQCREEKNNLGNFARVVKFRKVSNFRSPFQFLQPTNLTAPVYFFCTLFYLIQICPYVILFLS